MPAAANMGRSKKRILCFASYFLPGFRAGGPIRSLQRIIETLGTEFEFGVVTRDRDLGSDASFPGCNTSGWSTVSGISVRYLAPPFWGPTAIRAAIAEFRPDLLYFHSFWDPSLVAMPLLLLRIGAAGGRVPALVAPRGEFAPSALAIKGPQKALWMRLVRLLGLYRDVAWHASTALEAAHVHAHWGKDVRVLIAPDLPPQVPPAGFPVRAPKAKDSLRIVFLSRVSPMKNLDGALRMLQRVTMPMTLDIFGTQESAEYWETCTREIARLPAHVRATYRGVAPPDRVMEIIAGYDLFLLPTLGENFGHVILEALLAACPVLISDRTPWTDLSRHRAGFALDLQRPEAFVAALEEFSAMDDVEFRHWSEGARSLGRGYCADENNRREARAVLDAAMAR